jgi:hypothetical protein
MKKEIKINYVNNIFDNKPKGLVPFETIVEKIRNPKPELLSKILQARNFAKGSDQYDSIKRTLPCLIFNFNVIDGVKVENALESTGVIYLDIDWVSDESKEQIKKDLLNIPYLFSLWESASGKGYTITLRVDGVTLDNFGHFSDFIKKNYLFDWDKSCFNPTRKTCVSFDANAYLNNDCEVLSYDKVSSTPIITHYNIIDSKKIIGKGVDDTPNKGVDDTLPTKITRHYVRYNNRKDFTTDNAIEVYEDGIDVVEIQLNIKYREGNRNQGLFKDGIKFLFLNPKVDKIEDFIFHMHNFNKKKCQPILTDKEVAIISKKVFKNKDKYGVSTIKKKYIVNRDIIIDPRDAQSAVAYMINQNKRESTLNLLKSLYFDGMTQKELAKESEMGIATIKRYWKELNK